MTIGYTNMEEQLSVQDEKHKVNGVVEVGLSLSEKRDELIRRAVENYNIDIDKVYKCRELPYPQIRNAMYKILRNDGYTLISIAKAFQKNHATVIWGIELVNDSLQYNHDKRQRDIYLKLNFPPITVTKEQPITTSERLIRKWLVENNVDAVTKTSLMKTIHRLYLLLFRKSNQ